RCRVVTEGVAPGPSPDAGRLARMLSPVFASAVGFAPPVAGPLPLDAPTAAALLRSVDRFAAAALDDLAAPACRPLLRACPGGVPAAGEGLPGVGGGVRRPSDDRERAVRAGARTIVRIALGRGAGWPGRVGPSIPGLTLHATGRAGIIRRGRRVSPGGRHGAV